MPTQHPEIFDYLRAFFDGCNDHRQWAAINNGASVEEILFSDACLEELAAATATNSYAEHGWEAYDYAHAIWQAVNQDKQLKAALTPVLSKDDPEVAILKRHKMLPADWAG